MRLALLLLAILVAPAWADAPIILRGKPAEEIRPTGGAAPAPADAPLGVVGGGLVWFIDPGRERLTGCDVERTTDLGVRRIRCTTRNLP